MLLGKGLITGPWVRGAKIAFFNANMKVRNYQPSSGFQIEIENISVLFELYLNNQQ